MGTLKKELFLSEVATSKKEIFPQMATSENEPGMELRPVAATALGPYAAVTVASWSSRYR